MNQQNVAVLGASKNHERYSNKAIKLLIENKYHVIPINPVEQEIEGLKVYNKINEIKVNIDTLTIYINKNSLEHLINDIILLSPKRIILNPGTENELVKSKCSQNGIKVIEACTLVLLSTGQF